MSADNNDDDVDVKGYALVLVGDSDIDRWPSPLYPDASKHVVAGESGTTLSECVSLVQDAVQSGLMAESAEGDFFSNVFLVACAGENDMSQSTSLQESCKALEQFIAAVFRAEQDRLYLIFLGPKIEPWLDHDTESRRDYIRMSRAFAKICHNHAMAQRIRYVDCLLMFCGDSAHEKGALLGGKGKAEKVYFDYDLLHLNQKGYQIWKLQVEDCIKAFLTKSE